MYLGCGFSFKHLYNSSTQHSIKSKIVYDIFLYMLYFLNHTHMVFNNTNTNNILTHDYLTFKYKLMNIQLLCT